MAATAAARGGRPRPRDVLPMAASVTVTHTLGVVALGLLVTAGSAATPAVISWLGLTGGVLVLAAGVTLVRRAWRDRARATVAAQDGAGQRELATVGGGHSAGHHHHRHDGVEHTHGDHTHPHTHTHGGHTMVVPRTPTAATRTVTPPRPHSAARSCWGSPAGWCPARPPWSSWSAPPRSARPGSGCCSSWRTGPVSR
ncbi:hypothetical protein GCM10010345_08800 [Streptomyces canarius]|uniref:Nickel/cobalt efflux system n=1 Tax=Streptomyces canarius TaxID=285453 RepID=A0ABQ3CEZ1_9ACTN|nr:hypothetical protein GCM10010345_08800 [Streptomyces canarius]